jgi:molybdopterin/thiamine biosynthesis adenylyltransferase
MAKRRRGKHVVIVGLGNIGSHLVALIGRMDNVSHVTLIDPDRYELKNLLSQMIGRRNVDQSKAIMQARRLRRMNPERHVKSIVARVEDVPPAWLRSDVILAGLDSRAARRHVHEVAWRWGTTLIDAGVDAGGLLARVNVNTPGPESPCMECAWEQADYDALEQRYVCQPGNNVLTATNAPAELGALAAALVATECRKLLAGDVATTLAGRQVLHDLRHHKQYVTAFRCNRACRFDHETWNRDEMRTASLHWTLGQVKSWAEELSGHAAGTLKCFGRSWTRKLACAGCGCQTGDVLCLADPLPTPLQTCTCRLSMAPVGFHTSYELDLEDLAPADKARSLSELGMRPGDVIELDDRETIMRAVVARGFLHVRSSAQAEKPATGRVT